MEKKQSLLKRKQKKLSDGEAINPINVAIESKNQGGFQTKILIRDHEIISDQPFGFDGQNKGPKPSEVDWLHWLHVKKRPIGSLLRTWAST